MPKIKKLSQIEAEKGGKQESPETKEDSQLNKFLSKYTDDDDIQQEEKIKMPRKKSQKEQKPEIKTKNKLFADCDFEDSMECTKMEEFQQLEI